MFPTPRVTKLVAARGSKAGPSAQHEVLLTKRRDATHSGTWGPPCCDRGREQVMDGRFSGEREIKETLEHEEQEK